MTDCIFFGGKGGVGKTTCAAATGVSLVRSGDETLVVSTDPAHSLADSLSVAVGSEPTNLEFDDQFGTDSDGELWAVEIDPETRRDRYERLARAFAADLRSAGVRLEDADVERLFDTGTPAGGDELAALDLLVEYVDDGRWDVVVFDTAPTGHTLRLFETPAVMGSTLETLRSLGGQARRIGNAARTAVFGPMSMVRGRDDDLADFQARLERARELLVDPGQTEFRVVTVPERMAIAETERLVARLGEAGVPVERLIVNRVFEGPADGCSRCASRRDRHEHRVGEIRESFSDLEIQTLPDLEGEARGIEAVATIADRLAT
ncbi:ArsA family ATPase [Natrarchaeobius oligotrophus]|uniref:Arsenic-transporting ATPase n=1 Tax=Natrarchaeobius chitinivorans TaxID=1679083 RepID=A0A3N6MZW8_NATCH|nr:TRC40/GET3/ArsA family transport-energizing ATPase [Natrarchaeobius chitinivorans]RQH00717.1 arsenic-transporting ATPase [Natrarchaeobius chitinivorans]